MTIVSVLIGLILLLAGRRLFWLFVALIGFTTGMYLAREHLAVESNSLVLVIALVAGILGAILSVLVQKLAIGLAGFAAGAFAGSVFVKTFHLEPYTWAGLAVGGVLGMVFLITVFDWALIGLSSVVGAALVSNITVDHKTSALVFLTALIVGVVAQALEFNHRRSKMARRQNARPQE